MAVVVVAAVGTISMAVVQLIKELTPLRRYFHKWWIERWIDQNFNAASALMERARPCGASATIKHELIELSTGGLENALYDLPIEEVSVQINAAAQVSLDDPS